MKDITAKHYNCMEAQDMRNKDARLRDSTKFANNNNANAEVIPGKMIVTLLFMFLK